MYQTAIEANFSHEQMNPLNNILANSDLVHNRLYKLMQLCELSRIDMPFNQKETLKLSKAVKQSATCLWYFTQNQIQKMKIRKGDFKKVERPTFSILDRIKNVLNPFEVQIVKNEITVLTNIDNPKGASVIADFDMFELILFNII